ncbi:hypothetical protein KSC_106460 [Ktedonobacter sp. SOSP1-52]|nr:hypothetical protein KSC_106460 [Ktedonobacter sp. SOSP1-52]
MAKRPASHIHPSYWSEENWLSLTLNRSRWGQKTAHRTDSASPITFGTFR